MAPPVLAVLAALSLAVAAPPVVSWVSAPLQPNETAIVLGGGFEPSAAVRLSTTSATPVTSVVIQPVPGQTTSGSLKFIVPANFPADAWELEVFNNATGDASAPWVLNAAQPWWVQGDCGDTATPGGWLRVFGTSIAVLPPSVTELRARIHQVRDSMSSLATAVADVTADDSAFARSATELLELRARLAAAEQPVSVLRLTPVTGGAPVDITATASNASSWSAYFPLPAGLPPGSYNVSVSNGLGGAAAGWTPLDSFVSQSQPHVASVVIAPPRSWPGASRFTVATRSLPCRQPCNTSDDALAAALAAAAASGGGTVYFPRGQYFLTRAILVPPSTVLAGERMDLVALYFAEATNSTAPPAYFSAAVAPNSTSTVSWGVQDLTVYVSAFHHNIFDAGNTTDGFFLRRVRTRINAFFSQNDELTVTRGRATNFTWQSVGNVVQINARNYEITDCDLYGAFNVISSQRLGCMAKVWPGNCHASYYGYIARNTIYNGGSAHVMNQWMQVIFEQNTIVGASIMAMGQAVGTSGGGYDHHIAVLDNTYQGVFGNDREVMTFDDAGGSYWGPVAEVNGDVLTTAADCKATTEEWGGWVGGSIIVLNGTGAGQWRRIVVAGVYTDPNVTTNRTWVVDSPFAVTPDATSFIEIMPFRGRNVFARNSYADTGAFQFYGHAISNIVAENTMARGSGFLSWGQWRGWLPADLDAGGTMNNGAQPNVQNQFFDNTVVEGNSWQNYNSTGGGGCGTPSCFYAPVPGGFPNAFVLLPMEAEGHPAPSPSTMATVLRRSAVLSNAGVWIGESSWNTVLEGTTVAAADSCVTVDGEGVELFYERGTSCPPAV